MAGPGFSVTELIVAVGHVKTIYDSFFDKYASSASQLRDLVDTIDTFEENLKRHKRILEKGGLEYNGYVAIDRTLTECRAFLKEYMVVFEKNLSARKLWKTGSFVYEQETVNRLQRQLTNHGSNILHFNMNILVEEKLLSREETIKPDPIREALDIPGRQYKLPPPIIESPPNFQDPPFSESPESTTARSPKWARPRSRSRNDQRKASVQGSPRSDPTDPRLQNDFNNRRQDSDIYEPQDALPYRVATLCVGTKMVPLKRKIKGRDFAKGRELVIVDEKGDIKLKHEIKLDPRQSCYPYTWHRDSTERKLEVTFVGQPENAHSVQIYEKTLGPGIPFYIFNKREDYVEFQTQVRGEELVDYFDFRRIDSAVSKPEATDQHLKVWKNRITQDHSISFYASFAKQATDLEFPISMFKLEIDIKDSLVDMNFLIAAESKRGLSLSTKPSRTSTDRSGSSVASSGTSIWSRRPMAKKQMTMTTVADSGMSISSFTSEKSQGDDGKAGLTVTEAQAKRMKYVNIQFSDQKEAARFRILFEKVHKEDAFRASEYILNWQFDNTSAPGTPFPMSPVLGGQPSPTLRPQR